MSVSYEPGLPSAATPRRKGARAVDASCLWLGLYFVLNLALTLYNKIVLQYFHFPWMLTGIHTLVGAAGSYALCYFGFFTPAKLGDRESAVMLAFSILYTINIAISNVSLNMVSVPFHQVVRATTPIFTIMLSVTFLNKTYPLMIYVSLLPVVLGVAFATAGEGADSGRTTTTLVQNLCLLGFFLTVLGAVLAALKTVVTNRVQVGRLKLHPLDLLLRMSPLAFIQTVVYAYMRGELDDVRAYARAGMLTPGVAWSLLFNGFIAFCLNVVSFTANKNTSALTMTVAANVKQVLSIVVAVVIFSYTITATRGMGIVLTLLGGAWYSFLENQEKLRQQRRPVDEAGLVNGGPSLGDEKIAN